MAANGIPWYRSFRFRLVAAAITVELFMLGVLLGNSYRLIDTALETQTRDRIEALSPLLNAALSGYLFQRDISEINAILNELVRSKLTDIRYIVVADSLGNILARAGDTLPVALTGERAAASLDLGSQSGLTSHAHIPLSLEDNRLGSAWIGLSRANMVALRDAVLRESLVIAAIEVALSLLLLISGGFLLTRHFATLLGATRKIARGDFTSRVQVRGRDDISQLAHDFNLMADAVHNRLTELEVSKNALHNSERRFRTIFDNVSDAIFVHDAETGAILDVNQRMCEMYGFASREEAIRTSMTEISQAGPGDRSEEAQANLRAALAAPLTFEWQARTSAGRPFWTEVSLRLTELDNQRRILAVVRDIDERKRAEEQQRLAASVFSHAREGIMITDQDNRIVNVNATFSRITGYAREEVIGQTPSLLKSERHDAYFYARMWQALAEHGAWYGEIWDRRRNGELFPAILAISVVRGADGGIENYVALFSDITQLKRHEEELEFIAHFDVLTSLPNRVLFADRLQQAMYQAERTHTYLSVAYIDLDGFKEINDQYGHDVGDQLLAALAKRMKECLRDADTIARLGGDEFVAILPGLGATGLVHPLVSRLLEATATAVTLDGHCLKVTASIGITFYPQEDGIDADQLLRQADQAMYQAKLAGKNRYHLFDQREDRSVRGHHESLKHIAEAIAADQFVLHYQPKVNLRSGRLMGAEALIRWQHPERGLLLPGAFLPTIETHPLSVTLGEWVIEQALRQLEAWHGMGLDLPVSVNVGAMQLQQPDFPERIRALFARHPTVRPECLELEVLETSALQDIVHVSEIMKACRDIGVNFALDDFGTGYASLSYLKRLPAHTLKIDQSFILTMLDDPEDLRIVDGVLGLANAFHRTSIAEGVETYAHAQRLIQLGCELAQGYGIARPMPAGDFPAWARRWSEAPLVFPLPPIRRESLPLMFVITEHRAWVRQIERRLRQEAPVPAMEHQDACAFADWLRTRAGHWVHDAALLEAILQQHDALHACAARLLALSPAAGEDDIGALHAAMDAFEHAVNGALT